MSNLILDVRISSYKGNPTRVIATVNVETGLVYISAEKPFKPPAPSIMDLVDLAKKQLIQSRTIIVTDSVEIVPNWNVLYDEKQHFSEIISAYHLKSTGEMLKMHTQVQGRFNPHNVLQPRKVDAKQGVVWELSTDTTNGHVCVLVACWVALKAVGSHSFADQITREPDFSQHESDDMDEPFSII